ncbi:hypothetical protein PoB_000597800 [Plakobranchus ocellatus]|uniref:Uncharacterized protein n=1 Tax=Plakobranchus ocellatus TaxID=259542 RepID=A0AAV3YAD5_9GAST|nr:hypothetical protein PoB_000597800 [Plakobranchus ocellatus]
MVVTYKGNDYTVRAFSVKCLRDLTFLISNLVLTLIHTLSHFATDENIKLVYHSHPTSFCLFGPDNIKDNADFPVSARFLLPSWSGRREQRLKQKVSSPSLLETLTIQSLESAFPASRPRTATRDYTVTLTILTRVVILSSIKTTHSYQGSHCDTDHPHQRCHPFQHQDRAQLPEITL